MSKSGYQRTRVSLIALVIGAVTTIGATSASAAASAPSRESSKMTASAAPTNTDAADGPANAAAIAKKVQAGLVDITITLSDGEAAGTGMVLTSTGEVLTNNHVIDGATSIKVRDVGNGKTYKASILGYDETKDIAVLKLNGAKHLTTVTTATSEPGRGAEVVGVGNAGGTGGTPSYAGGAIDATNQTITAASESGDDAETLTGLLETDAAIEPGDSGGPLVNTSGRVVGMDSAASSSETYGGDDGGYAFGGPPFGGFPFGGGDDDGNTTSSASSAGYAIPIVAALRLVHDIAAGRASSTVHIGPTAVLGVYVSEQEYFTPGAVILGVVAGSGAAKAGLAVGDIITSIGGVSVGSADALSAEMSELRAGRTVTVGFTDDAGASHSVAVTLGSGVPL